MATANLIHMHNKTEEIDTMHLLGEIRMRSREATLLLNKEGHSRHTVGGSSTAEVRMAHTVG